MVSAVTDSHFFDTTSKSRVTPIQGQLSDQPELNRVLLLVLDWGETVEFVYESYSIFIKDHPEIEPPVVEVQPAPVRSKKPAEEVIKKYITNHKEETDEITSVENILACNPHKFPPQKLLSQYI